MVEADSHLKLLPASMLTIYKVNVTDPKIFQWLSNPVTGPKGRYDPSNPVTGPKGRKSKSIIESTSVGNLCVYEINVASQKLC